MSDRISTREVLKRLKSLERWDELWNLRPLLIEDLERVIREIERLRAEVAQYKAEFGPHRAQALRPADEPPPAPVVDGDYTHEPHAGPGVVRYISCGYSPTGAQCDYALKSDLYRLGDAILVWVNQGDILAHGRRLAHKTTQDRK